MYYDKNHGLCLSQTKKTNEIDYEVVIVGAGIVGATLAVALSKAGFQVLVIDSAIPTFLTNNVLPDLRISAISSSSASLLQHLKVWHRIGNRFCAPYRRLETWECQSSIVSFDAASIGKPELGFIVENIRIQQALWQEFSNCTSLTLRCPTFIDAMFYNGNCWRLILNDNSIINSKIVVGADGTKSYVRQKVGITVNGWQYRQSCLLLSIQTEVKQQDVTWQAFYPSGPKAFLPLYNRWASLAWYDTIPRIHQLERLSLSDLAQEVKTAFPSRLGRFTLHDRVSFPLIRQHASYYVKPGLVLIGDAAHTIHPLAGQGANLGFRDVKVLTEILINARQHNKPWNTLAILQHYQYLRRGDNLLMQAIMDAFYVVFGNNSLPILLSRNIGLMLAERSSFLKKQVLRYMC